MNNCHPLVSVVVITYNSASFIFETLDSVKYQTYDKIELIISDDCSSDATISCIKLWLKENSIFFIRAELIESSVNTGVSSNLNRGIRKATGAWIKILSGDDKLLPNSITDYVEFTSMHPKCKICFGKFYFDGKDVEYVKAEKDHYEVTYYPYLKADYKIQWRRIQKVLFVPGPGLFYQKSLWEKVGGFDERFPFAEEYPFIYNVLECGERIYFLDKEVYSYSIRDGSLCRDTNRRMSYRVFNDQWKFIRKVLFWKSLRHGYVLVPLYVLIRTCFAQLVNKITMPH